MALEQPDRGGIVGRYGDEVDVAFVLRRLGTPDDMAVAVVLVASDAGSR